MFSVQNVQSLLENVTSCPVDCLTHDTAKSKHCNLILSYSHTDTCITTTTWYKNIKKSISEITRNKFKFRNLETKQQHEREKIKHRVSAQNIPDAERCNERLIKHKKTLSKKLRFIAAHFGRISHYLAATVTTKQQIQKTIASSDNAQFVRMASCENLQSTQLRRITLPSSWHGHKQASVRYCPYIHHISH